MSEADQKSMFKTIVALGFMIFVLTGCSYITDLFPDKQKVYRYSSDIPPLEIPPDLTSSTIKGVSSGGEGMRDASAQDSLDSGQADASGAKSPAPAMPSRRTKAVVAILAQGDDDVPFVDVAAPFAETWNFVARSLGRMEIEVTEQSRSDRQYFVYFAGEKSGKSDDAGWWQSLTGGGDKAEHDEKAEQFHIKLEPKDDHTHIYVLDSANKPVLQGSGLQLLKKLRDTLDGLEKQEFINAATAPVVSSLGQGAHGAPVVNIQAPLAESWNYIGRALSQMELKVTDKNRSDQLYFVDYGGNAGKEQGAWSSLQGVFGGSGEETESFRLKLEPQDERTQVYVLDASNKPVSEGLGLKLIKQLQQSLDELGKPASK
jgi:outer membrane protein assembly factor BamC